MLEVKFHPSLIEDDRALPKLAAIIAEEVGKVIDHYTSSLIFVNVGEFKYRGLMKTPRHGVLGSLRASTVRP